MSNIVIDIRLKSRTNYFFNDIINIKDFDPNIGKIDEKSYKNIFINYIGYMTIKKDQNIYSVNALYIFFNTENGYFKKLMKISI